MIRLARTAGAPPRATPGFRLRLVLCAAAAVSAASAPAPVAAQQSTVPLGLPAVTVPKENPLSAEKIALGKQLYFDRRLSIDNTVSCADCHAPAKGWSNGEQFATGIEGKKGGRNAPTILNTAYQKFQFWDGRAGSLEEQALGPIQNPIEMALSLEELEKRLNGIEGYRRQFKAVFGANTVTRQDVAKAIAAFERTVLSGNSPFDRFKAGDNQALSPAAKRGMDLFFGKAHCSACHTGPNFTDNAFHNIGVGMDAKEPDRGREEVSKMLGDRGSFKTPTVRDAARTAPYMHDGSLKTLEEVVEHYNKGGIANPQLDEEIFPLTLTAEQKADLVTFLKEGLASDPFPTAEPPELPK
jgi:cytochrome c peroxidase